MLIKQTWIQFYRHIWGVFKNEIFAFYMRFTHAFTGIGSTIRFHRRGCEQ
jgi:hypothetical protein